MTSTQLPIRLVVGLGNPGPDYDNTRHNAGFWLADQLAREWRVDFQLEKTFQAWVAKTRIEGEAVLLAKPTTFMNRSGQAAGALLRFFKLPPQQMLVLHDELDLLPGQAKLKQGGGHAGHNGLRDIQSACGSADFWRLRLGIGHPRSLGLAQEVVSFVLKPPRKEELQAIDEALERSRVIMPALLRGDYRQAMAQLHEGNR